MTEPLLPPENKPKKNKLSSVLIPVAVILAIVLVALSSLKKFEKSKSSVPGDEHSHLDVTKGTILPDLEFKGLDQKAVLLSSIPAKVTLINFWASWCGPCLSEIPSINALRKKYHDQGFEVVGINVDDNPEVVLAQFQKKLGMEFTSYLDTDGDLADRFDVHGIPFTVILDKNRKVLLVETGDRDWFDKDIQKQLEAWLGDLS